MLKKMGMLSKRINEFVQSVVSVFADEETFMYQLQVPCCVDGIDSERNWLTSTSNFPEIVGRLFERKKKLKIVKHLAELR